MTRVRIDGEHWGRCGKCGHKLFKVNYFAGCSIEIKCHSCKSINLLENDNKEESDKWQPTEKVTR